MSERQHIFPQLPDGVIAMADEPVLLDGMKVLFDQKVALYPVQLEEPVAPAAQRRAARSFQRARSRRSRT